MTTEEKAKAYDEAVNKIKPLYEQAKKDGNPIWSTYEYLIPELAESEDERIRKALIEVFKKKLERGFEWVEYGIPNRSVLDWLEKQKEASKAIEAVDRIDKYIDENTTNAHDMKDSHPDKKYCQGIDNTLSDIAGILQDVYSEDENKFAPRVLPCSAAWFEDGDEKQKEQKPWKVGENAYFDPNTEMWFIKKEQKPADNPKWAELTWKDINELERIINNVHYEFQNGIGEDSFGELVLEKFREYKEDEYTDEKEQKPVEQKVSRSQIHHELLQNGTITMEEYLKLTENLYFPRKQKPSEWSVEDEDRIRQIERIAQQAGCTQKLQEEIHDWLRSLRPRLSDEEIKKIRSEEYTKGFNDAAFGGKLKEWSEEDENCIRNLESVIYYDKYLPTDTRIKLGDFLKSLRPSWKPSEEQMKALESCGQCNKQVYSLYLDLKKL